MGLQQCHECKKDVSSEAKNCPSCGAPVKKPISKIIKIGGPIVLIFFLMAFIVLLLSPNPSTPPAGNDPKTASDKQIYREYEICMQYALKTKADDKLRGDEMTTNCFSQLQKYGPERAKKTLATYFDMDYKEKKKK